VTKDAFHTASSILQSQITALEAETMNLQTEKHELTRRLAEAADGHTRAQARADKKIAKLEAILARFEVELTNVKTRKTQLGMELTAREEAEGGHRLKVRAQGRLCAVTCVELLLVVSLLILRACVGCCSHRPLQKYSPTYRDRSPHARSPISTVSQAVDCAIATVSAAGSSSPHRPSLRVLASPFAELNAASAHGVDATISRLTPELPTDRTEESEEEANADK
jgi:hypothetical protein